MRLTFSDYALLENKWSNSALMSGLEHITLGNKTSYSGDGYFPTRYPACLGKYELDLPLHELAHIIEDWDNRDRSPVALFGLKYKKSAFITLMGDEYCEPVTMQACMREVRTVEIQRVMLGMMAADFGLSNKEVNESSFRFIKALEYLADFLNVPHLHAKGSTKSRVDWLFFYGQQYAQENDLYRMVLERLPQINASIGRQRQQAA